MNRISISCIICYCLGVEIEKCTQIEYFFFSVYKLFVVCWTLYTIQAFVLNRNEQKIKWCQFLLQLFNSSAFSPDDLKKKKKFFCSDFIFCFCFVSWTCVFCSLFVASKITRQLMDVERKTGSYAEQTLNIIKRTNACLTIVWKTTNATAAAAPAASSFEPDFVFPLENVTVAQGRDGLYLNKSKWNFRKTFSSLFSQHNSLILDADDEMTQNETERERER